MNVVIEIVMYGLIALVPPAELPGEMTALLVDSEHAIAHEAALRPVQYGGCLVEHAPEIIFPTSSQACTKYGAPCTLGLDGLCHCLLSKSEEGHKRKYLINWDSTPQTQEVTHGRVPTAPSSTLPFSFKMKSGGSPEWVPNISSLLSKPGRTLEKYRPNLKSENIQLKRASLTSLPDGLTARAHFAVDEIFACDLSTRPEAGAKNVHAFSFRPIGSPPHSDSLTQAIASKVVAVQKIVTSPGSHVNLVLQEFGGSEEPRKLVFPLPTDVQEFRITLRNERPYFDNPDHPCDDGIGRDFALFYQLAEDVPAWNLRPIPHIEHTIYRNQEAVEPKKCANYKASHDRPICAMAMFPAPLDGEQE